MGAAIRLRTDYDGAAVRRVARTTKDANQARRLLALAEIYDGGRRSDAARIGGAGLQIVRALRANKRETFGWLKFTLEGAGARTHGYAFTDTDFDGCRI